VILGAHQAALLMERRCGTCAERLGARDVWAGKACRWCKQPVFATGTFDAEGLAAGVTGKWQKWRTGVVVLVGVACLITGLVPLLAPVVFAAAMILANFVLIRQPLRWLRPARRLSTRLSLKILLAGLTLANLILSVLVYPLFGVAQVTTAIISSLLALAYVEAALRLTSAGLRREAAQTPLQVWEWLPPTLLLGACFLFILVVSATAGGAFWLLLETEIPDVSTIVDWLSEWSSS
jgi:hypothetical protein